MDEYEGCVGYVPGGRYVLVVLGTAGADVVIAAAGFATEEEAEAKAEELKADASGPAGSTVMLCVNMDLQAVEWVEAKVVVRADEWV